MLISIFASIGSQNLWDELILKNEVNILRERYNTSPKPSPQGEGVATKDIKFVVFSYDPKNPFYKSSDIVYKEYFPIWSKNPKNIFRNIKNFFSFLGVVIKSDLIVIWWGWIIYDKEKQTTKSPLDAWVFRTNIFRLFFKKFSFFWVWISIDEKNTDSQAKVKKIFKKAKSIEVRDDYSHNLLKKLWIKSKVILDPVFSDKNPPISVFPPEGERSSHKDRSLINRKLCLKKLDSRDFTLNDLKRIDFADKKVWLAFRRWYISKTDNPQMEVLIIKEIIEYIQNSGWKVILLPHSFHKDDILANDYEWMKLILEKVKWVEITNSMEETYETYKNKKIDLCLAERLHSIILSNVYEIPFVAISYGKKTNEVLRDF